MSHPITLATAVVTLAASSLLAQCDSSCGAKAKTSPTSMQVGEARPSQDIVDLAVGAGSFKTLVAAVKAAGLVDTLKGKGPFTVFAPTDDAFAKLPTGTIEKLLADKAALTRILTYHVVPGNVRAEQVVASSWLDTVQGQAIQVQTSDAGVRVDGANIVKTDLEASNGIVHVIDTVMMPRKDIVDTAVAAGSFKTLATALTAAGLVETLKGKGPFTVFAPNDAAFAKVPGAALKNLLADKKALTGVLTYHVVPGRLLATDVLGSKWLKTAQGQSLWVNDGPNGPQIDGARIIATDIVAGNGIIHVLDSVVMPRKNIVETAAAAGSFKTLATALEAAGLVDALQGNGPFTVFAPTDAAFAKLPAGTVEALLKDLPKLKSILLYHVVAGRTMSSDLPMTEDGASSTTPATLQGSTVEIRCGADGVTVNNAKVVKADIVTSNGVIHVIDTVILPR